MALTDTIIRNAKYQGKQIKLSDEKGMYLLVNQAGKYFRLDYRFADKRKTLALGVYPETSLKEAREKRDQARKMIANGINPSEVRKLNRQNLIDDTENNFESIASEWYVKYKSKWTPQHAERKWRALEKDVFPYIGKMRVCK
jgi:hypothetical protein